MNKKTNKKLLCIPCVLWAFFCFELLNFGFVSDFEFRISDFKPSRVFAFFAATFRVFRVFRGQEK